MKFQKRNQRRVEEILRKFYIKFEESLENLWNFKTNMENV